MRFLSIKSSAMLLFLASNGFDGGIGGVMGSINLERPIPDCPNGDCAGGVTAEAIKQVLRDLSRFEINAELVAPSALDRRIAAVNAIEDLNGDVIEAKQAVLRNLNNNRFIASMELNDLEKVSQLYVDGGVDINFENGMGATALTRAAGFGYTQIVEFLLSKGANVNQKTAKRGNTALLWAAYGGHLETVGMLLEAGADVDQRVMDPETTVLDYMIRNKKAGNQQRDEIIKVLHVVHILSDLEEKMNKSFSEDQFPTLKTELESLQLDGFANTRRQQTLQLLARIQGELERVARLDINIELVGLAEFETRIAAIGAIDVSVNKAVRQHISQTRQKLLNNALIAAVGDGNIVEVNKYLCLGAHVNFINGIGASALRKAVALGNADIVKVLLERGAIVEEGVLQFVKVNASRIFPILKRGKWVAREKMF